MTWLLAAATVLLGASTVIRLVGDSGLQWFVLAVAVMPLLVPPLLVLGITQLLLRRRRMALMTAVLVALNVVWLVPLYVADPVRRGQPLAVMTANLRFGLADPVVLVALVKQHQVDVLATEELTPEAVELLRDAGLEHELPYAELSAASGADGCGLWSRYPLTGLRPLRARFQSPGALISTPSGAVAVRVLHPSATTLNGTALYRHDYSVLTSQVRALDRTVPTVLAGDFNASTDQSALRILMGGRFRDASELAGSGFQRTWSPNLGWPALLHLDHVLVDRQVDARFTEVLDLPGSDHRALLARLVVT